MSFSSVFFVFVLSELQQPKGENLEKDAVTNLETVTNKLATWDTFFFFAQSNLKRFYSCDEEQTEQLWSRNNDKQQV